jgi:hypothetical protein
MTGACPAVDVTDGNRNGLDWLPDIDSTPPSVEHAVSNTRTEANATAFVSLIFPIITANPIHSNLYG